MLSFFKRRPAATPAEPTTPKRSPPKVSRPSRPLEPVPAPQVTEGNEDSDWAMWEDSVSFMDSQIPSLPQDSVRVRAPAEKSDKDAAQTDAFSSVRRRGT